MARMTVWALRVRSPGETQCVSPQPRRPSTRPPARLHARLPARPSDWPTNRNAHRPPSTCSHMLSARNLNFHTSRQNSTTATEIVSICRKSHLRAFGVKIQLCKDQGLSMASMAIPPEKHDSWGSRILTQVLIHSRTAQLECSLGIFKHDSSGTC